MDNNFAIQLFEGKKVRFEWDEKQEKYWQSSNNGRKLDEYEKLNHTFHNINYNSVLCRLAVAFCAKTRKRVQIYFQQRILKSI